MHRSSQCGEAMEVFEAIQSRRSIRAYKGTEVPDEAVTKLVEAAQWAPSAGNIQPWEFVVVRRQKTKHQLVEAALGQSFIDEAPVVIVVCADERRSARSYGQRGKALFCLQDTAAAIQNMHLAAHALGLGTCWIGAFDEDKVRRILSVPSGVRPVALIPLGYPDESPSSRRKRSMSEIVHSEVF